MEITQNQGKKDFEIYLVRQYVREKMDAPNAPNPTNPTAQDQFVDAVQGPASQAQGLAAQAQVPAVQGLAAQGHAKNNAPVGQNAPIQPPQQLAHKSQSLLVWWCLPLK